MNTKKSRNFSRAATAAVLIATTWSMGPTPLSAAETDLAACGGLAGTYVTTFTDREGVFSSRGLMTFTSDGLLLMSDSAQGGVPGIWDPFSTAQGAWSCLAADGEKLSISAVGLNFVLPADGRTPSFGKVDYRASLDTKTGMLSGSATLSITSGKDLEGADPIDKPGPVVDKFHFDGERVVAK
jgi:hypothetical protein